MLVQHKVLARTERRTNCTSSTLDGAMKTYKMAVNLIGRTIGRTPSYRVDVSWAQSPKVRF